MKTLSNFDIGTVIVAVIILITYFTLEKAKFPDGKLPLGRTVLVLVAVVGILVFVLLAYFAG